MVSLGALIEHDRAYSAALVPTFSAYLEACLSKAETAQRLGINRQSLYARIERVPGMSLAEAGHLAGVALALTAWRLQTRIDPHAGVDP